MKVFPIGAKVKYDATKYGGGFFTGTIHGYYVNNEELYYSVELDKKHQTMIDLKGFDNESDSKLFLSVVVCHCDFVFELKE